MNLVIRQENPTDIPAVQAVVKAAFEGMEFSDQTESQLVLNLRKSDAFIPELSLVAELDGQVIGHILLTVVFVVENEKKVVSLSLAPVSVLPEHQRKGVGRKLIIEAHRIAKSLGYRSVLLVGHADYYPRFGYKKASLFGITFPFEAPDEAAMALELVEEALANVRGKVLFPKEFFELG